MVEGVEGMNEGEHGVTGARMIGYRENGGSGESKAEMGRR
jgi:hypothetical protein